MKVGKQMQFFGARVNAAKALLYAINGGRDEMSGKQVMEGYEPVQGDGPLDFDDVWKRYEEMLDWVVGTYVEALNIIHYCHDRYAYEAIEMALHDAEIIRTMGCGIAGLSIVADSLAAIKYAKVYPIRDETGLVVDYRTEGDFPTYGNDDDRADDIRCDRRPHRHGQDSRDPHVPRRDPDPVGPDDHLERRLRQGHRLLPVGPREGHPLRPRREPGERHRHARHGRLHAVGRQAGLQRRARRHLADEHESPRRASAVQGRADPEPGRHPRAGFVPDDSCAYDGTKGY